jgi:ABC-type multidrug transport system fused ATPase/permease subunit
MRNFRRLATWMLRDKGALFAAVAFALVSAGGLGLGLVGAAPLLRLILEEGSSLPAELRHLDQAKLGGVLPEGLLAALPTDRMGGVTVLLGALVLLTFVGATANFLHEFLAARVAARAVAGVRQEAFRAAIHLPLSTVVQRGPAEFTARIVRDAAELQRGFMVLTSRSVAQISKGLAAFGAAVLIDWRLTIGALLVAPPMVVLLRKLGKRIRRGTRGALEAQEVLLRTATETLQGLRSVKASRAERSALGRFRRANQAALRSELGVRTARALAGPVVESLAIVVLCALAFFAAREIIDGSLAFDRFVLALGSLGVAGASFKPLAAFVGEMQAAEAPATRLVDVIDATPEDRGRNRRRLMRPSGALRFDEVSVRYPGAAEDALRQVSLEIPHGQWVALVGPNGCGKTTLASLVPKLLVPNSGRVCIDGVDLAEVALSSLRRSVGVVSQEVILFRGTIADNIAFGLPGVTRESIVDAARRAHAAEFIEALPMGYDGVVAELGASLSGGQRQRLAIARALLRKPSILILDEATSQIDPESERMINDALSTLSGACTLLTIAHRVSGMRAAERIIVMDAGRVVGDGSHEGLLATCPPYARLIGQEIVLEEPAGDAGAPQVASVGDPGA